jgi:hypothetical protein
MGASMACCTHADMLVVWGIVSLQPRMFCGGLLTKTAGALQSAAMRQALFGKDCR